MDQFLQVSELTLGKKWTKSFGTSANDDVFGLAIGPDKSVYLVGTKGGSGPYDPASFDGYLAKFSKDGNFLWSSNISHDCPLCK